MVRIFYADKAIGIEPSDKKYEPFDICQIEVYEMSEELKSVIIQRRWLSDNRFTIFDRAIKILFKAWEDYSNQQRHEQQLYQLVHSLCLAGLTMENGKPQLKSMDKGYDLKISIDKEGVFSVSDRPSYFRFVDFPVQLTDGVQIKADLLTKSGSGVLPYNFKIVGNDNERESLTLNEGKRWTNDVLVSPDAMKDIQEWGKEDIDNEPSPAYVVEAEPKKINFREFL